MFKGLICNLERNSSNSIAINSFNIVAWMFGELNSDDDVVDINDTDDTDDIDDIDTDDNDSRLDHDIGDDGDPNDDADPNQR